MALSQGMTRARWRTFVTHELLEKLGQERLIFWGNLRIHYNSSMRDKRREAGHAVFFTPAYSPEGNSIEYMFSKLKTYLRK